VKVLQRLWAVAKPASGLQAARTTRKKALSHRLLVAFGSVAVVTALLTSTLQMGATPAYAAAYFFRPGDPTYMHLSSGVVPCTGGYAVRRDTDNALFILSDAHCTNNAVNVPVYGTDRQFGTVQYTRPALGDTKTDSALIKEVAGDDAYQIVRDPKTGRVPGGTGKVVGVLSSSSFTNGLLIGKMGVTSGWTEGRIYGHTDNFNGSGITVYCYNGVTMGGDSGGPVWRTAPGGGVYALGIVINHNVDNQSGCFFPLDKLLGRWGAHLPVFSSGS
jgi:hypothetical protein